MAWKLCLIASLAFINGISAEAEAEADPQYFQLGNRLGKLAGLVIGELSKVLTSIYLHLKTVFG